MRVDFPGADRNILEIAPWLKFQEGIYTIHDSVNSNVIDIDTVCKSLSGTILNSTLDSQKERVYGLPNIIAQSLYQSKIEINITTRAQFKRELRTIPDLLLIEDQTLSEGMYLLFTEKIEDQISELDQASGLFYQTDSLAKILYESPMIIIFDPSEGLDPTSIGVTEKEIMLTDFVASMHHEAGHAVDHVNNGYDGFASNNINYTKVYNKLFIPNIPERTPAINSSDSHFLKFSEYYEQHERPAEITAEMVKKYSYLYHTHPQIAEQFMSKNFPYIWDELKKIMPQIEESLIKQGYDNHARPLFSNPHMYILNEKYFSQGNDKGETHLPVFGLSNNERYELKELLKRNEIDIKEEKLEAIDWFVIDQRDLHKIDSLRKKTETIIHKPLIELSETNQFLDNVRQEETRIESLFSTLGARNLDVRIGFDGSLNIEFHKNFETNRLTKIELSEDMKIYTSSPDRVRYAIPYNDIPDLYKPNLNRQESSKSDPSPSM